MLTPADIESQLSSRLLETQSLKLTAKQLQAQLTQLKGSLAALTAATGATKTATTATPVLNSITAVSKTVSVGLTPKLVIPTVKINVSNVSNNINETIGGAAGSNGNAVIPFTNPPANQINNRAFNIPYTFTTGNGSPLFVMVQIQFQILPNAAATSVVGAQIWQSNGIPFVSIQHTVVANVAWLSTETLYAIIAPGETYTVVPNTSAPRQGSNNLNVNLAGWWEQ